MDDKSVLATAAQKPKKSKKNMPQTIVPTPPFHDLIGAKLRSFYAQIASEPVPDRFTELLKKLDTQTQSEEKKS
jgi:Anti-sigma factor NepR